MAQLNEALRRLERRAARFATSGSPVAESSAERWTDANRLIAEPEVITVVVEVDQELTVGQCIERFVPAHPPSSARSSDKVYTPSSSEPIARQNAEPVEAPASIKRPSQDPEPAKVAEADHNLAIGESSVTDVERRAEQAPVTDSATSSLDETAEPTTFQRLPAAAAIDEDDYHRTCRNLLENMLEARCPVLLLASEEGQAATLDLVQKLMVTLAELSDDPVLAIDACGERLSRRFNVIAGSENHESHEGGSWSDAIVQTMSPGLCLLTMGPTRTSVPAKTLREQFDELKSRFGLIAIDAGSATNAHICSLSAVAAGSLFLVRLDVTTEDWVIQARNRVAAWGAAPVGCIVTIPQRAAA